MSDTPNQPVNLDIDSPEVRALAEAEGAECYVLSSVTGAGLEPAKRALQVAVAAGRAAQAEAEDDDAELGDTED